MLEFIVLGVSIYIASKRMEKKPIQERKSTEEKEVEIWQKKIQNYLDSPKPKKMSLGEYSNMFSDLEKMGFDTKHIELD